MLSALALLTACVLFMTLGTRGDWGFVLAFRGPKLVALVTIAAAVAVSTVAFQTVTGNRILTPAIMGFDALYLVLQTGLVFFLSAGEYGALGSLPRFALVTAAMMSAALLLFGVLLRQGSDLNRLVLTGIILGTLLRSLSTFMNRLMDPAEYAMVQVVSFARFNTIDKDLVWIALPLTALAMAALMLRHRRLDVMALGRDAATGLGLDHAKESRWVLLLVSLLVAIPTALVGPVVFFGLLVSALAHQIAGTWRHAVLLPVAALVSATVLVGCQTLFERVLGFQATVSVVIEALGGLVFLYLILRRPAR
ncbi:iron chelate uptake ABC transporter family permease subunit [Pseudoroseicyclus tamaricis]|uniref:iron chelate uptake ABC transporter family permease subunit n=1 Tax=Pseudoroseicyclus tamaricis TaxID=2705421 RepID=UPI002E2C19EB|nr:iron chelate uptake ABC transporter family permease subunit [Pseudoroseicyclus tamaricis]